MPLQSIEGNQGIEPLENFYYLFFISSHCKVEPMLGLKFVSSDKM